MKLKNCIAMENIIPGVFFKILALLKTLWFEGIQRQEGAHPLLNLPE